MTVRALKTMAKRRWHDAFRLLQRLGVNVVPAHFYSGIPDLSDLGRRSDWRRPRSMHGINQRSVEGQIALLGAWLAPRGQLRAGPAAHQGAIVGGDEGGGYGEVEAEVLY